MGIIYTTPRRNMSRNYYTGFSQAKLILQQHTILNIVQTEFAKHYPQTDGTAPVNFTVNQVRLQNSGHELNVIECQPKRVINEKPFVIMHGYGAGGAMFANNLAGLAYSLNRPVYAVDWIGFGASDRPKFKENSTSKTMDFFIKPFQEWLNLMGFKKIDLMGHGLGGFLVGHYCVNYSGEKFVDNLILASPAGVPHKPPPNPDQEIPFVFKVFRKLWGWGFTPGGVIRGIGSWSGKSLVEKAVSKRFIHGKSLGLYGDIENSAVDYMHQMFAAPGSGEYAYEPLIDELPKLKETNVLFLYGTRDWMSINSARRCCLKMSDGIVKRAGTVEGTHHLYLDSPESFDK